MSSNRSDRIVRENLFVNEKKIKTYWKTNIAWLIPFTDYRTYSFICFIARKVNEIKNLFAEIELAILI